MLPIMFKPGQQIKSFTIYRKKTSVSTTGRVGYSAEEVPIGTMKGTISQASQKEADHFKQMGHPITHTVTIRGKSLAEVEDVLRIDGRAFQIMSKGNPGELGFFTIYYCRERMGLEERQMDE